jgi:hypothetical protein
MIEFNKFVEGYLTSVLVYRKERKVCFSLQEVAGTNWILTASGVTELMVLQMRLQNIIDRISIWNASSDVSDYGDKLLSLFIGTLSEDNNMDMPLVKNAAQSIKSGELFLLEIEPVYGAIVLALVKDLSILKQPDIRE